MVSPLREPALPNGPVASPHSLSASPNMEAYMAMSKEEVINELILAKANELWKKGYEVKEAGASREYISLSRMNMKL